MGRERQIQKNEETRKAIIDAAVSIGLEEGFDPVFAFTVGKLKVEGDLGNALEIQKLIKNNISKQKAGKPPAFSAMFDKLF